MIQRHCGNKPLQIQIKFYAYETPLKKSGLRVWELDSDTAQRFHPVMDQRAVALATPYFTESSTTHVHPEHQFQALHPVSFSICTTNTRIASSMDKRRKCFSSEDDTWSSFLTSGFLLINADESARLTAASLDKTRFYTRVVLVLQFGIYWDTLHANVILRDADHDITITPLDHRQCSSCHNHITRS